MLHYVDGSLRTYFNDESMCYEFCTVTNKFKVRKIIDNGFCLYSNLSFINDNNRLTIKKRSIVHGICQFILGLNMDSDFIICYKDDNYKNLSVDNIVIKYLDEYCDNWVIPYQFNGRYKLSSSGLVYDCDTKSLVKFSENGAYFTINRFSVHRLVWQYFGDTPLCDSKVVDHIDNNIHNNDIKNLQLVSQNINIKKERSIFTDRQNISITYNNRTYYLGKRQYHTYEEAEKMYYIALSYAENGTIDSYFCEHDYIRYDFLLCKWKIINLPNKGDKEFKNDRLFDSYDECEVYFNKVLSELNLVYYPIGSKGYYLDRNKIHFKYNGMSYKFRLLKTDKAFSEKVIDLFLSITNEEFIKMIPELNKERDYLKANKIPLKTESVKNLIKSECSNEILTYYSEFNSKSNYSYSNLDKHYVFNIPFNGKYYLLGSIQDESLVKEIDEKIKTQKNNIDFLEWLSNFKDEFMSYQKKSEEKRNNILRQESKGYYYFKARNCWKSHVGYENEKICLGYFKDELAAKYMYQEAVLMIEHGIFKKWLIYLKEHQQRIKTLFGY